MTFVVTNYIKMKLTPDTSFNLDVTQTIWQKKVKRHKAVESSDGFLNYLA